MKRVFSIFLAGFFALSNFAWAANDSASADAKTRREAIVLLPVKGAGLLESELSIYRDSVADGLGNRYTVKFGEQVDKVIKEVFDAESKENLECDETRCYKDIAAALNVQLVAKASVFKSGENFQLSLVIYNVLENRAEETKTDYCTKCNSIELSQKLKAMAGGESAAPAVVAQEEKGTSWWWYLLGALAVGGAAAAGGSKSGGSSSPSTPSPGNVTVAW